MSQPHEWKQPRWMVDCMDHYWKVAKRGPTTGELLAWREADASCRMERDYDYYCPGCGHQMHDDVCFCGHV